MEAQYFRVASECCTDHLPEKPEDFQPTQIMILKKFFGRENTAYELSILINPNKFSGLI